MVRRYMLATRPHELGGCKPNVCPHSGGLQADDKPLNSHNAVSRAFICPSTAELGAQGWSESHSSSPAGVAVCVLEYTVTVAETASHCQVGASHPTVVCLGIRTAPC